MKRTLIALLAGSALLLAACSTRTTSSLTADPRVFPSPTPVPTAAAALGATSVERVVERVLPAVVNVVTDRGEGTGFVIRQDGVVVTNYHVVECSSEVSVLSSDESPDRYEARVIGGDQQADLAVLKIDATGLPTVPLGDSDQLDLGQQVVAIGYSLGLEGGPSVTAGIVSSLTRQIEVADPSAGANCTNGRRVYGDVIQTDAAINPGNSGGPLVDLAGNVVGINTAGTTSAENVGFAIQINAAKPTIFHAAEDPDAPVAFMGIGATDASDPAFRFEFDPAVDEGAGLVNVVDGGPADDAGIRVGDVVVEFDGQAVTGADDLGSAIRSHAPGDEVEVVVVRSGGERETLTVTLGVNPVPTG
jgi:S1-C subfamily serine protease